MPSDRSDVDMLTLRESKPPQISIAIDHYVHVTRFPATSGAANRTQPRSGLSTS